MLTLSFPLEDLTRRRIRTMSKSARIVRTVMTDTMMITTLEVEGVLLSWY